MVLHFLNKFSEGKATSIQMNFINADIFIDIKWKRVGAGETGRGRYKFYLINFVGLNGFVL